MTNYSILALHVSQHTRCHDTPHIAMTHCWLFRHITCCHHILQYTATMVHHTLNTVCHNVMAHHTTMIHCGMPHSCGTIHCHDIASTVRTLPRHSTRVMAQHILPQFSTHVVMAHHYELRLTTDSVFNNMLWLELSNMKTLLNIIYVSFILPAN